jgi:hypothetical protein
MVMKKNTAKKQSVLGFALMLGTISLAHAGPPFMTDDPEPLESGHSEAYIFSMVDKAPDANAMVVPAFEYNNAPAPDLHLHIVVPFLATRPNDGSNTYGLGDIEVGVKYRFVHESDSRPQVGVFPMLELPTGDAEKELGNGRAWGMIPLWLQKSWGSWTTYGGGGVALNSAPGMKNYVFGGWLLQRAISDSLILGGELFYQGAPSEDVGRSTFFNVGGFYSGIRACGGCSLLFRAGSTVAGEVHHEGYLGLYWTWGPAEGT